MIFTKLYSIISSTCHSPNGKGLLLFLWVHDFVMQGNQMCTHTKVN